MSNSPSRAGTCWLVGGKFNNYINQMKRILLYTYVLLLGVLVSSPLRAMQVDSLPRLKTSVLDLRLSSPKLHYKSAPSYGSFVGNGATVLVAGNRTIGSVQLERLALERPRVTPRANDLEVYTRPIEVRVAGRRVYFDSELTQCAVVDLTGRVLILAQQVRELSLDQCRSGIYILRCEREGISSVTKIILQ